MFGRRRSGPNRWLLGFWLLSMAAIGIVVWQFHTIQPKVLALVTAPGTPTPMAAEYARRGDAAFWKGDLTASIDNYRLAANQNPNNVDIVYELVRMLIYRSYGDIRFKATDVSDAIKWASQLVDHNPNNARAYTINCFALVRADQDDDAVRSCLRAITLNPSDPDTHAYYSMAQYDLQQYSKALEEADQAINGLRANTIDTNLAYARILTFYGRGTEALDYFKRAAEVNERLEFPYYELASLARGLAIKTSDESKFLLAIGAYRAVLSMSKDNVKAYTRICQAYLEKSSRSEEDINLARLNCKRATQIDPEYSPGWRWYGEVLHNSRDYEGAIFALETCRTLEEDKLRLAIADRDPACLWLQAADHFVLGRDDIDPAHHSDCDLAVRLANQVLDWKLNDGTANQQAHIVINKCAKAYQGQYKTPTPIPTPTSKPVPIL